MPKESFEDLKVHYFVLWFMLLYSFLPPYLPALLFLILQFCVVFAFCTTKMTFWKLLSIAVLKVFLLLGEKIEEQGRIFSIVP